MKIKLITLLVSGLLLINSVPTFTMDSQHQLTSEKQAALTQEESGAIVTKDTGRSSLDWARIAAYGSAGVLGGSFFAALIGARILGFKFTPIAEAYRSVVSYLFFGSAASCVITGSTCAALEMREKDTSKTSAARKLAAFGIALTPVVVGALTAHALSQIRIRTYSHSQREVLNFGAILQKAEASTASNK
jgi:hypothetical protein